MKRSRSQSDDIGNLPSLFALQAGSLPDWGPYSNQYAGIAHIPKNDNHSPLEFSFVCGYYGGSRIAPNVVYDCGYHHWRADKGLTYYSYRYELEWKDKVYADLEFFSVDDQTRLAKITYHNNRPFRQQFEAILVATLREPHQWTTLNLQAGESWIPAEKYREISHWDHSRSKNITPGRL